MKSPKEQIDLKMQAGDMEIRVEEWGEMAVEHITLPPGTDGTPLYEGLPDDLCPCPHWGRVLEGELHMRYADGSEETITSGEFFYTPPGHVGRTDEGVVFLEVSPADQLRPVMEHLQTKLAG